MRSQISKKQASILNMLLTGVNQLVTTVIGFIIPELLLTTYGASLHGYTSTVSNLMKSVALINAGLYSASVQALYEPLTRRDARQISGTVNVIGYYYDISGFLYTLAVLGAAALLPHFLSAQLPPLVIALLMIVMGAEQTMECFICSKYRVLLQADQRLYVAALTDTAVYLVRVAGQLLLIYLRANIIWVMAVPAAGVLLRMVLFSAYCRRNYPELDHTVRGDKTALAKRWPAMIHQFSGIIVFNTDITLLTFFGTLVQVSVYSVYQMVFNQLYQTLNSIFSKGTMASFGRLLCEEDHEPLLKAYDLYEYGCYAVVTFIYGVSASTILPFVGIYTRRLPDIPYVDTGLAVLFVLVALFNALRLPAGTLISAAGHFRETQWRAILEAAINLGVSLALIKPLGMYGLLIGTVCSFAYRTTDIIVYSHKHILKIPWGKTFHRILRSGGVILASVWLYSRMTGGCRVVTWGQWILYATAASLLTGTLTVAVFFLAEREQFTECLGVVFHRKKNG